MKQLKVFYLFAAILLYGMMLSCDSITPGEEDDNGSSSSGSNNLKSGQIEMKVYPDKNNKVSFSAKVQKITIDWGDGMIDDLTPHSIDRYFTHFYSNPNLHTVKINTEEMTGVYSEENFVLGFSFGYGSFKELRFGNCSELKSISSFNSDLTVLAVTSKCTALTYITCRRSQLSASALNSLFNSLPTRKVEDKAILFYGGNPGYDTCDKTIAEKKGWEVVY